MEDQSEVSSAVTKQVKHGRLRKFDTRSQNKLTTHNALKPG
jgi:hypothetical protein